jgi:D-arabinose 1-dehydrogenase-like Zn-dependent alcohol dehydrogenase
VLPATSVAKLPAGLSFEQGASLVKAGLTGRQAVEALGVTAGDRVLVSGGLGTVGRSAIQYLKQIGAQPVAGVRPERLSEGRELAGEALDITLPTASPGFAYAISTAGPVAANLIGHISDGGTVASIVPVPEGANAGDRLTIHELFHRTDAATLDAVLDAAVRGLLVIPISHSFTLEVRCGADCGRSRSPGQGRAQTLRVQDRAGAWGGSPDHAPFSGGCTGRSLTAKHPS